MQDYEIGLYLLLFLLSMLALLAAYGFDAISDE